MSILIDRVRAYVESELSNYTPEGVRKTSPPPLGDDDCPDAYQTWLSGFATGVLQCVVHHLDELEPETGGPVVQFDVDEARYVGDGDHGVYYQAAEGDDGWYVSLVVECPSFTEDMTVDDGPYASEAEAWRAGHNGGADWCLTNGVVV